MADNVLTLHTIKQHSDRNKPGPDFISKLHFFSNYKKYDYNQWDYDHSLSSRVDPDRHDTQYQIQNGFWTSAGMEGHEYKSGIHHFMINFQEVLREGTEQRRQDVTDPSPSPSLEQPLSNPMLATVMMHLRLVQLSAESNKTKQGAYETCKICSQSLKGFTLPKPKLQQERCWTWIKQCQKSRIHQRLIKMLLSVSAAFDSLNNSMWAFVDTFCGSVPCMVYMYILLFFSLLPS